MVDNQLIVSMASSLILAYIAWCFLRCGWVEFFAFHSAIGALAIWRRTLISTCTPPLGSRDNHTDTKIATVDTQPSLSADMSEM